jgi:glutathione S-transferase
MIRGHDWVMGNQFTVVDPYALVFYGWGVNSGFPMQELKNYTAWRERMMQRPAVKKSVEMEAKVGG